MPLTVVGCGTLGIAVCRIWDGPAIGITATTRRHPKLRTVLPELELSTTLQIHGPTVISAPSSAQDAVLDRLADHDPPSSAVFVSSTGVYGEPKGLVDADTPPGHTERARRLHDLEQRFRAWCPVGSVLRLGGLYHDTRGPAAVFERDGTARLGPPNRPLPLIHYADAARLVVRLLRQPEPTLLGVVHQPTRETYYTTIAARLGVDPPAFSAAIPHPWRYEPVRLDAPRPW